MKHGFPSPTPEFPASWNTDSRAPLEFLAEEGGAWDPAFPRDSQLSGDAASLQATLCVQRSRSFSKPSARKYPVPCRVDAEVENSQKKITHVLLWW